MPRGHGREDLTGKVFGRLTVLRLVGVVWECQCSCGSIALVKAGNLKSSTQSCGCLKKELLQAKKVTHGMTGTPEYQSWFAMLQRCSNPKHQYWYRYGKRGIKVCERWLKFENFFEDMGLKPSAEHSLDRRKLDEDYSKGNCRWATTTEQAENKSNTLHLTYNGKTQAASAWAREYSISKSTIYSRISKGWSIEKILGLEGT